MVDFLSFRTLVSGGVIRIAYVLGLITITSVAGATVYIGVRNFFGPPSTVNGGVVEMGIGIAEFVGLNLAWRLMCESWIVFFRLYEVMKDIQEIGLPEPYRFDDEPVEVSP